MLVATPAAPSLADRKPRVISEIRKPHVQRSPSLGDLPRFSGILNYYCSILGVWTQRTVSVRDGCLFVYGADCSGWRFTTPGRGYASLGRRPPLSHTRSDSESLPYIPYLPLHTSTQTSPPESLGCHASERTPLHHTRSDSTPSSGVQSLGRSRGALAGLEFRLPLRHLNLMPSSLAPRAFSLSYRQKGGNSTPVAVLQALNDLEYEHWVKTLAVEIMRQTPLDAIRFLDVLGIASISTPSNKSSPAATPSAVTTKFTKLCESANSKKIHPRSTAQTSAPRWDRSPSSEGSTTSADFMLHEKKALDGEAASRSKKITSLGQSLPRRKLCMSDVESQSDEVDSVASKSFSKHKTPDIKCLSTGRKSREKLRRSRDVGGNGSSSEETRTIDEGIVLEERESSSERSCRRSLWPSDRSDCLDSPHSVSSYSSYELCDSPDTADSVEEPASTQINRTFIKRALATGNTKCAGSEPVIERIYCKNVNIAVYHSNLIKKKCEKKAASEKTLPTAVKKPIVESVAKISPDRKASQEVKTDGQLQMPLYRAQPYNTACPVLSRFETLLKKDEFNDRLSISAQISSTKKTAPLSKPAPSIIINKIQRKESADIKGTHLWNRARSCSPGNGGASPPREGRGARALSVGQPPEPSVELLRLHCQDTEKYVPVKDKLALFESLCRAGRLARSSEELAAGAEQPAARARSLHDLTRDRSPHVPVREMCKFFETFGNSDSEKQRTRRNIPQPAQRRFSENLPDTVPRGQAGLRVGHESRGVKDDTNTTTKPQSSKPSNRDKVNSKNVTDPYCSYPKMKIDSPKCKTRGKVPTNIHKVNEGSESVSAASEAFDYGGFKQIRLGNKIITYV